MNAGMMWFDNDPKTPLNAKVIKAVAYYTEKYGLVPNTCLVNPSALTEQTEISGITVRPYRPVLPGHLWIGIKETK